MNLQKVEDVIQGKLQLTGMGDDRVQATSAALVKRVQEGLLKSPHTLKKFKLRCAAEWGMEWPPKKKLKPSNALIGHYQSRGQGLGNRD